MIYDAGYDLCMFVCLFVLGWAFFWLLISQFSAKVLELARKQRMNTDVRRNIFCVLMTSEDYLDAFEKLLRFGSTFSLSFFFVCFFFAHRFLRDLLFQCFCFPRLGLKGQQERDIVHVLLDCCLQEKTFNGFYAVLAEKFCSHDRRFQVPQGIVSHALSFPLL